MSAVSDSYDRPKVSVILPAYNAQATVANAICSVLHQTMASLELIACDDASSDGTLAAMANISDRRLRILTNEVNLGVGRTRDKAIAQARAPWIALIDADDVWAPTRLARLLEVAGDDTGRLVFDDLLLCHDTAAGMKPWKRLRGNRAFGADGAPVDVPVPDYILSERLLIKPIIPIEAIRRYRLLHSDRRFGEDAEYFIRLGIKGLRFTYVPEPLYHYRVTPDSLTAQAIDKDAMRSCIEALSSEPAEDAIRDALRGKTAHLRDNEALYQLRSSLLRGDAWSFGRVVRANPALLPRLLKRLPTHVYYQVHRVLSRGRRRD